MQTMTQVAWWKRLLLAFSATLIWLIVISALFAIIGAARGDEPLNVFFKQGGDAQGGAEIFFIGGYFFALPCFFLIAAPLVLLVR